MYQNYRTCNDSSLNLTAVSYPCTDNGYNPTLTAGPSTSNYASVDSAGPATSVVCGPYVGINELISSESSILIWPVPVGDDGMIYLSERTTGELISIQGRVITRFENHTSLDVHELTLGLYFVKTETGAIEKVVIP